MWARHWRMPTESRSVARWAQGQEGWRDDFHRALMMSRNTDPMSQSAVVAITYSAAIYNGVILADDVALRDIQEALDTAERSADDLALGFALLAMGSALVERNSAAADRGLQLLRQVREMSVGDRFYRAHCHSSMRGSVGGLRGVATATGHCQCCAQPTMICSLAGSSVIARPRPAYLVRELLADSDESGVAGS